VLCFPNPDTLFTAPGRVHYGRNIPSNTTSNTTRNIYWRTGTCDEPTLETHKTLTPFRYQSQTTCLRFKAQTAWGGGTSVMRIPTFPTRRIRTGNRNHQTHDP
jgi:hypothetical protein